MIIKGMEKFIVSDNDVNQTIFKFIKKMFKTTSLSLIYKLFRNKKIKLNNQVVKDFKTTLKLNDEIIIFDSFLKSTSRNNVIKPSNIKLEIAYEDDNILIVVKNHDVEMHSLQYDCLDWAVKNYLYNKNAFQYQANKSFVISHVHRLDKFTKGLVIYAKNKIALDNLLLAIKDKNMIEKIYTLRCEGLIKQSLTAEGYLTKNEPNKKMLFSPSNNNKGAKYSKTIFKVLNHQDNTTWLEAVLETGRKHQIRASLSYLNHPICNDIKYNAKKINEQNMIFLYASELRFYNMKEPLNYLNQLVIKKNMYQ